MAKKKKSKAVEIVESEATQTIQATGNPSSALLDEFKIEELDTRDEVAVEIQTASIEIEANEVKADADVGEVLVSDAVEASNVGDAENAKLLITDRTQIKQVLEAIIFSAPKAMSTIRLRNLLNHFNYDSAPMVEILDEMIAETSDRGFQLIKVAGGYQFRSHPEHSEVLQKLLEDKPARLSASALEVLSIVAYKQPVSRGDIDSVRGVDSGHLMKGLLEKNLVRTLGHAETPGRPLLYGTTSYFLEVFSLGSLDDLAQMDEIKRELAPGENSELNGEASLEAGLESDSFSELAGLVDSSGLAANPSRGAFDLPHEEETHHADFGVQDRAREELNSEPTA